jgi:hypothetical protein
MSVVAEKAGWKEEVHSTVFKDWEKKKKITVGAEGIINQTKVVQAGK